MVTEHLISELAQPLFFHADIFCRVVQVELSPIAWKQCTVIWNLQISLFQLLSNILAYKNPHVCMFFRKVLSVAFKASLTIFSVSKGLLVIQVVHGKMSYDVLFPLFVPLSLPPFKNVMKIFYVSFFFTACKLTPLPSSCLLGFLCNWKVR